jgi:DNA polymerase III delta prime subunit
MDAQSALRRCIELYNHNTRFFIVVENKYKLLKPILSRFCEIYVPSPIKQEILKSIETHHGSIVGIDDQKPIHLYAYHLENALHLNSVELHRQGLLKKILSNFYDSEIGIKEEKAIFELANRLYEKAYSSFDILALLEKGGKNGYLSWLKKKTKQTITPEQDELLFHKIHAWIFDFNSIRKEYRNEVMLLAYMLQSLQQV